MARMTTKGQITIPKEVRDRYGLLPGTEVLFESCEDGLRLRKGKRHTRIERWKGALKLPKEVDAFIADLRGGS